MPVELAPWLHLRSGAPCVRRSSIYLGSGAPCVRRRGNKSWIGAVVMNKAKCFVTERRCKQKQKYWGMFETQKSRNKTSSGDIGFNIRTLASPKLGQDQVSGGVSVPCWHVITCKYFIPPFIISNQVIIVVNIAVIQSKSRVLIGSIAQVASALILYFLCIIWLLCIVVRQRPIKGEPTFVAIY